MFENFKFLFEIIFKKNFGKDFFNFRTKNLKFFEKETIQENFSIFKNECKIFLKFFHKNNITTAFFFEMI